MKPVAIFRHVSIEGPGYLTEVFDEQNIPWQLIAIDSGDPVPKNAMDYSGLVFMGGPMSVNDDLPWIATVQGLIRDAFANDIPLLGHCLGGQLMSKALGGKVTSNPVKEIGWGEVTVLDDDVARSWFGSERTFSAFHWHGETFSIPRGATPVLSSEYCLNQAWAWGKHFALQCHVEMTSEMIETWCIAGADELAASINSPAVFSASEIHEQTTGKLIQLQNIATHLYGNWVTGLGRL